MGLVYYNTVSIIIDIGHIIQRSLWCLFNGLRAYRQLSCCKGHYTGGAVVHNGKKYRFMNACMPFQLRILLQCSILSAIILGIWILSIVMSKHVCHDVAL